MLSYYNYLSVNDIWDYLRLCCNPVNPWCIKFQANHKGENQHLAEMFKACDLHRNIFAQALPDEDLASLLVNEENMSKVHPKLLTDEIPSQVIPNYSLTKYHQNCDGS